MKHAKWLVLSHALCLALGGLVFWLLIARPRSAADADTIAGLRAGANNVEKQLADHLVIDRLVDDSLNETRNQLQAVTDALGRSINETTYWRTNYNKVRAELKSITDSIAVGISGIADSQGIVGEIKTTVQRSIEIVDKLQADFRGGGPSTQ
jgi:uncharacterized phage infection (PIP) family protein YhgE